MRETGDEEWPLPYTLAGHGIVKENPTRCLRCLQPIREQDDWTKYISGDDPELGRYSFVVHRSCPVPQALSEKSKREETR